MSAERTVTLPRSVHLAFAITAAVGLGVLAVGLAAAPARGFTSLLVGAFFWLTVALGGLVFIALGHVGAAGWSSVLRRVAEGLAAWLPFGAASLVVVLAGLPHVYHWAHGAAGDPVLAAKQAWLDGPFFAARMLAALGLWLAFALLLRRGSRAQDRDARLAHTRRAVALSAAFLFVFALSFSMASFDWLMSTEPHWSSTIFGLYNLAGVLIAGVAAVAVVAIVLCRAGLLRAVNENHIHDLGKYLFGFTTLWAYLWFSQYMLIWYANLPEEAAYFVARTHGGWGFLFWLNPVAGWLLPFLVLLPRPAKRSEGHVFRVALWVLGARWLDVYLMAKPGGMPVHAGIDVLDVAAFLGLGAAFALVVARALGAAPLLPQHDPYLAEGLHHEA